MIEYDHTMVTRRQLLVLATILKIDKNPNPYCKAQPKSQGYKAKRQNPEFTKDYDSLAYAPESMG